MCMCQTGQKTLIIVLTLILMLKSNKTVATGWFEKWKKSMVQSGNLEHRRHTTSSFKNQFVCQNIQVCQNNAIINAILVPVACPWLLVGHSASVQIANGLKCRHCLAKFIFFLAKKIFWCHGVLFILHSLMLQPITGSFRANHVFNLKVDSLRCSSMFEWKISWSAERTRFFLSQRVQTWHITFS